MRHEIIAKNTDVEIRFYFSEDQGSYVPPHWHDGIEIVYVIEGSVTIMAEGCKEVLSEQEFGIINLRTVHAVFSEKNKALVLQMPRDFLVRYVPDIEKYYFRTKMHPEAQEKKIKLETVRNIFRDMYIVYDQREEGYLLKFNSLLFEMLFVLLRDCASKINGRDLDKVYKYLASVNQMMQYLKEHHAEKCTVSGMAGIFGYSGDYLSRIFKKCTGMSVTDYLYAYRVERVHQDLIRTDQSISEILAKHGCSNYRVFMRTFKEIYGCTPKEKRMCHSERLSR